MLFHQGENIRINTPCALTIGKFDGLHRGHIALIRNLQNLAKINNLETAVLTFDPSPIGFFGSSEPPPLLNDAEKQARLKAMGINHYIKYPFTADFAALSPEAFVRDILATQLTTRLLTIGADYQFGHNRAGNTTTMQSLGKKYNIKIHIINLITQNNKKISTNTIRALLAKGNISEAEEMLGYSL